MTAPCVSVFDMVGTPGRRECSRMGRPDAPTPHGHGHRWPDELGDRADMCLWDHAAKPAATSGDLDDHFPPCVTFVEVLERLSALSERVRPIDDRRERT